MSAVTQGESSRKTSLKDSLAFIKDPLYFSLTVLLVIFLGWCALHASPYLLVPWLGYSFMTLFYISGLTAIICIFSRATAALIGGDKAATHEARSASLGTTIARLFLGGIGFLLCCAWTVFLGIFLIATDGWQSYEYKGTTYYQRDLHFFDPGEECAIREQSFFIFTESVDERGICHWSV